MTGLIFSFDVGKASLGICVREGNQLHLLESLLIPAEFGDTSDLRPRRRAYLTRLAHKKRENWLLQKWQEAGLALPERQQAGCPFLREFPARGDQTIYNAALLRIALLQERSLAEWQIFKALWASIQHRGYDPDCKWERPSADTITDKDTQENLESLQKFEEALNYNVHSQPAYQFPCYLEAATMGLWNLDNPQALQLRVSANAGKARGRVAPRHYVEKEVRALLKNASKQLPALKHLNTEEWLYGPAQEKYASLKNEYAYHRGSEWDAQGLLSQKVPRFDNRIINKCGMLPKRNVCKANDKEKLNVHFVLLQKLKNTRFRLASAPEESMEGRLNPEQLRDAFHFCLKEIETKQAKETKNLQLSANELKKQIEKTMPGEKIVDHNLGAQDRVNWNLTGRARYCRPALKIMNRILLEGIDPPNFDMKPYVEAHPKGITLEELEAMQGRLGKTWDGFHPGDKRQENLMTARIQTLEQRERDIIAQIGNVNNPVVRHRLTMIDNQIKRLVASYGEPDVVMLEFVRGLEGLDGQKTALEWENTIKTNTRKNDQIRKHLEEAGLKATPWNLERFKLGEEQLWRCPYTDEKLSISNLDDYDVDHIVPVSNLIATDALYNKVLCLHTANRGSNGKNDRTPCEWKSLEPDWNAYLQRVQDRASVAGGYGYRKKALLTSPKARDLIQNYNGLAETAYIARLTQAMIATRFAWPLGNADENRRIFVNDGRITSKIRRTYQLNELLLSKEEQEALEAARNIGERRDIWQKNRRNKKHHALDAYCISYAQQFRGETKPNGGVRWYAPRKNDAPGLEETKGLMKQQLDALFPETLRRNTKKLYPMETIYGYRSRSDSSESSQGKQWDSVIQRHYLTVRKELTSFLEKDRKKIKLIYDPVLRQALTTLSDQTPNAAEWKELLGKFKHPVLKSAVKKVQVIESQAEAPPVKDETGRTSFGEYKDFGNQKKVDPKGFSKGITLGQYRHSTANQGQMLVMEGKKWKVLPVLSHEKRSALLQNLKNQGQKIYQDGALFYAGCQIHVPVFFKAGKDELPDGNYNLMSMWSAGPVKISDSNGIEYLTSVNYLTAADFRLVK